MLNEYWQVASLLDFVNTVSKQPRGEDNKKYSSDTEEVTQVNCVCPLIYEPPQDNGTR